ncbi:MAG: tRNA pseudouridine(55) synthase TruB [Clostridiales bacterium]|nr:tRNA pseudouridine(55) synthase TruB [Clostridiales bacterium]
MGRNMLGFLNINKPSGVTSNYVVQRIKHKFHIKKIGHLGTLDPLASGVLPIAIGKATRLFDYTLAKDKRYIAVFDFGYTTDTLDITGNVTSSGGYIPTISEISSVCSDMIGSQDQIPPMFSAKNVNGVRAYELARQGIQVDLRPKEITIHSLTCTQDLGGGRYIFDIVCSSGTYIRSIARDIASKLDTYACMSVLNRVRCGEFDIDNAIDLEDLLSQDSLDEYLISPLKVLPKFDRITISDQDLADILNGKSITTKPINTPTFVMHNENIVGVVKQSNDKLKLDTFLYEEGND